MGMKFFSDCRPTPTVGDPNPRNFTVERAEVIGDYTLAVVTYPDCKPASRRKILVYAGNVVTLLQVTSYLDPHFYNGKFSPTARFDNEEMAEEFCRNCPRPR
jgi:hypothetical protein